MKIRILLIGFFIAFVLNLQAQWHYRYYPDKPLTDLNQQELSVLYQKSLELRNTGRIVTISGELIIATGATVGLFAGMIDLFALLGSGETAVSKSTYNISCGIMIAGTVVALIGAPIWITGASRKKELTDLMNFRISDSVVAFSPALHYNAGQNKYIPGLSVSFRF